MKQFASEFVSRYGMTKASNQNGDKIYIRVLENRARKRVVTLEQLYGCKECCVKIKTYYKSGKVDSDFIFGVTDDVFSNKEEYGYER